MPGSQRRLLRIHLLFVLFAALPGCGEAKPHETLAAVSVQTDFGSRFDPTSAGTIEGRVCWHGQVPKVAAYDVLANPIGGQVFHTRHSRPNPNAPVIDSRTKGVGNGIVFLRGVDARQSRPWDLPSVRIEQRNCQLHIVQGAADGPFGIVRRGDLVAMSSRDSFFHSLHAGGAAFFTLTFPDPDQPLQRRLNESGIVELSSAAGYFWMRAYLFVDDHPYYARTDVEGRFELAQVPPGRYELVCWLPEWKEARHERDPESGLITRLYFAPPKESKQPVIVRRGETLHTEFAISEGISD